MYRLAGLVICIDKFGCSCFSAEPAGCDGFFSPNRDVQTLYSPLTGASAVISGRQLGPQIDLCPWHGTFTEQLAR